MLIQKAFGEVIRSIRLSKGISQEKLAFECELDRTYISGIERGVRNITLQSVYKIAQTLNLSLEELFKQVDIKLIVLRHIED